MLCLVPRISPSSVGLETMYGNIAATMYVFLHPPDTSLHLVGNPTLVNKSSEGRDTLFEGGGQFLCGTNTWRFR
jgi:hypothetical protein